MWDSHIRVGGAKGSDLDFAGCPKLAALNPQCICSSLLLHVTADASGYFENVWAWIADQYVDNNAVPIFDLITPGLASDTYLLATTTNLYIASLTHQRTKSAFMALEEC